MRIVVYRDPPGPVVWYDEAVTVTVLKHFFAPDIPAELVVAGQQLTGQTSILFPPRSVVAVFLLNVFYYQYCNKVVGFRNCKRYVFSLP